MERECLERLYLDCLRKQFPTTEQFQQATTDYLASQEYEVADQTRAWPRDVRICVIKELSCTDISRLARTCKHWAATITSQSYDFFWRARYVRDYPEYPPSDEVPRTLPNTAIQIRWFDLYQYVNARRALTRKQFSARTLPKFLMRKYNAEFFNDKFPDVNFGWDWQCEMVSLDLLPFRTSELEKQLVYFYPERSSSDVFMIRVIAQIAAYSPFFPLVEARPFKDFVVSQKQNNSKSDIYEAMLKYLHLIYSPSITIKRWANIQIV